MSVILVRGRPAERRPLLWRARGLFICLAVRPLDRAREHWQGQLRTLVLLTGKATFRGVCDRRRWTVTRGLRGPCAFNSTSVNSNAVSLFGSPCDRCFCVAIVGDSWAVSITAH